MRNLTQQTTRQQTTEWMRGSWTASLQRGLLAAAIIIAAAGLSAPAAAADLDYMPTTPQGTPDLQGIWTAWNTAQYGLEAHSGATGIRPGKSFVVEPANGMIPYVPVARSQQQDNLLHRFERDSVYTSCYMTGVPRFVTSGFPFQIFQTERYIMLASEYAHMLRYVYMDRDEHIYEGLDFWNGDSIGRWEGNTLVVDTVNFNDETWLDASGNHHSTQLHVIEKFTRTSEDHMRYVAIVEDPGVLTQPFTIEMELHRDSDPYAQLLEYECHAYFEDDAAVVPDEQ